MKLDLDYGYGINNVFWKSILDDCSEEEEKVIRARLKRKLQGNTRNFKNLKKNMKKSDNTKNSLLKKSNKI